MRKTIPVLVGVLLLTGCTSNGERVANAINSANASIQAQSSPSPGYLDVNRLDEAITSAMRPQAEKQGFTLNGVICVAKSTPREFVCDISESPSRVATIYVTVSEDGQTWLPRATP